MEEATWASRKYEEFSSVRAKPGRSGIQAESHRTPSGEVQDSVPDSGRDSVQAESGQMASHILAGSEQLANHQASSEVGPGPAAPDDDPTQAQPGQLLGAYRLATDSGFVVFVATAGLRGPDLRVGVGLGLPGDGDLTRVLEHGRVVNLDNILELCKWKPTT